MVTNKIFLFTDYRRQFYSSTKYRGASVDLQYLEEKFAKYGFKLVMSHFDSIDFREQNYENEWVLYQSSEDPGLHYRSYIEDIILGLYLQGAKLIPRFEHLRAHHNKHFLEILRDIHNDKLVKNLKSQRYGTYEDYLKNLNKFDTDNFVLKASDTSKSKKVHLLDTVQKKPDYPRKYQKHPLCKMRNIYLRGLQPKINQYLYQITERSLYYNLLYLI